MNENSTSIKNYNFIKNQPLGEDLFKNKSQEKIALVISEKIINEPDFKIITSIHNYTFSLSTLVIFANNKSFNSSSFLFSVIIFKERRKIL